MCIRATVDVLDMLCCPSKAAKYRADMTSKELDHYACTMVEDYRKERENGHIKANRLTESTHEQLELYFVEELEPFIEHLGCQKFRSDANPDHKAQYDLPAAERSPDYKCPLTSAARTWSTQLEKYWVRVVRCFKATLKSAEETGKWPPAEIEVAKHRVRKAEHLWKNRFLANYIGLQMGFPEPLLTVKFLKNVHKLIQPSGEAIAMVSTLRTLFIQT